MFSNNAPAPQDKTVVLLSGGIDSAVTLALASENTCEKVFALSFDYGQKHVKELRCAHDLAKYYSANHHITSMTCLAHFSALTEDSVVAPGTIKSGMTDLPLLPRTWKPGRNILFLAFAGAYAWWVGSNLIALGVHQEDYPGYPDCRQNFLQFMESALNTGLSHPIEIWAPLLFMNKTKIVELGTKLKVPFEQTWSCYAGGEAPCGSCDACQRREQAFAIAGRQDPLCM